MPTNSVTNDAAPATELYHLRETVANIDAALGNGVNENLWPTGFTRAEAIKQLVERRAPASPTRTRLPDERPSVTWRVNIDCQTEDYPHGVTIYVTVGMDSDGYMRELFLTAERQGSLIRGLLDGIATVVSISLQYGIPLQDLTKKMRHTAFEPSGYVRAAPLGDRESKRPFLARSVLDALAALCDLRFPDGKLAL